MSEMPGMHPKHEQVGAFFNVIGQVSRDPDDSGLGYIYESGEAIAHPVGHVSEQLQTRHGLSPEDVLDRLLTASELAVVVRQHLEPRMPDEEVDILN
jgi:hypothetical protein